MSKTMDCQRRTRRQDPGNSRVSPREVLGLQLISQAQPVSTEQYRRYLNMSGRIARRSLQKLRNMGLVQAHVVRLHEPNRVTLTRKGCQELTRALALEPNGLHAMRGIGKVNLTHHDGSVDLLVDLTVACARSQKVRLEAFLMERQLRARLGNPSAQLIPDSVAVVRLHTGERAAFCVEVDLGTENPSYVSRTKVEGYAAAWEDNRPVLGCERWAVLCLAPTLRRRNRLVQSAWQAGVPEGLWFWAVADEVTDRTILGSVWMTPRSDGQHARLVKAAPLTTVPTTCTNSWTRQDDDNGDQVGHLPGPGGGVSPPEGRTT